MKIIERVLTKIASEVEKLNLAVSVTPFGSWALDITIAADPWNNFSVKLQQIFEQ